MLAQMSIELESLRMRLNQVRIKACMQGIDHTSSLLKLAKEIGIGLSCLCAFVNNKYHPRVKSYGLILRYVLKMEKELGIV